MLFSFPSSLLFLHPYNSVCQIINSVIKWYELMLAFRLQSKMQNSHSVLWDNMCIERWAKLSVSRQSRNSLAPVWTVPRTLLALTRTAVSEDHATSNNSISLTTPAPVSNIVCNNSLSDSLGPLYSLFLQNYDLVSYLYKQNHAPALLEWPLQSLKVIGSHTWFNPVHMIFSCMISYDDKFSSSAKNVVSVH